jgi:hypothetical protein
VKVVDAENSLDLGEKASQESEVPSGNPYEARYDLGNELLVRERDAGWRPSSFEQFLNLSRIERTVTISSAGKVANDGALTPHEPSKASPPKHC